MPEYNVPLSIVFESPDSVITPNPTPCGEVRGKNKLFHMKVKVEGHTYELSNFEHKYAEGQTLQFIHKKPKEEGSVELKTVSDGTTNEEVLEVLINRMEYLQSKFPCRENAIVITKLQESLMWLEKRTADRVKRNVEGKQMA
jgi:hypothetical protein